MGNAITGQQSVNFDKRELKILYKNFTQLDSDNSGKLEPNELIDVPELKELKDNPIAKRIVTVFDRNKDGKISFFEFVHGLSALASSGII
jgi:serine/threonine-protein phosphatase 2B regulatory subunit